MFTYKYFILLFLVLLLLFNFMPPILKKKNNTLPYFSVLTLYCPDILSYIISYDRNVFDTIDDIVLGALIDNHINISEFHFIGKALISTIINSTPNCLRINVENRMNYNNGYIYFEQQDQLLSQYEQFILELGSLLCFHLFEYDISDKILFHVNNYDINDKIKIINDVTSILLFYEDRIKMCAYFLKKYRKIQFESFFSFNLS